jgi:hypothetical protein
MVGWLVNNNKGFKKKGAVVQSKYSLLISVEGLREITKTLRIYCVTADFRTEHLQNTSEQHYRYINLLRSFLYSFRKTCLMNVQVFIVRCTNVWILTVFHDACLLPPFLVKYRDRKHLLYTCIELPCSYYIAAALHTNHYRLGIKLCRDCWPRQDAKVRHLYFLNSCSLSLEKKGVRAVKKGAEHSATAVSDFHD